MGSGPISPEMSTVLVARRVAVGVRTTSREAKKEHGDRARKDPRFESAISFGLRGALSGAAVIEIAIALGAACGRPDILSAVFHR